MRVAVAGAGFWGMNHARILSEIEDSELVGICDIDILKAKRAAAKYNIGSYYGDYVEMIRKSRPEAVTICTPSTTHADLAVTALGYGVDVLVEKPMATSVEEAMRIMDVQNKSGRIVMVGFIERFNPAVRYAMKLVGEEEVGQVILSYSRRIGWWPERIGDVGVVKDTAVHDIDLTLRFFGGLPENVSARAGRLRHRHEDHAQIFLTFRDGGSAIVEANWLTPRKKREMHITGEKGVIAVKFIEQELTVEKEDHVMIPNIKYVEPLRLELQHFISCVKGAVRPEVDSADGFRAALIADAVLYSAETNKQIRIDEFIAGKRLANPYI
ncbi:MAG: Gfo/Idh/MocA family oxidoreductase [Nitrososphaerota archaeon]